MSMCVGGIRGQRLSSDPLELELEATVSPPYIGDGLQIQVL